MVIGMEGALAVHFTGSANAESFTLVVAIQFVAMVLIGGLDSIAGAVIGAALIASLPQLVPKVVSAFASSEWAQKNGGPASQMVYGALLVIFVVSTPDGLIGVFRRIRASALKVADRSSRSRVRSYSSEGVQGGELT
jgi:branched-chain amino acid transport system permease protein